MSNKMQHGIPLHVYEQDWISKVMGDPQGAWTTDVDTGLGSGKS